MQNKMKVYLISPLEEKINEETKQNYEKISESFFLLILIISIIKLIN